MLLVGIFSLTGLALEEPWSGTDLELAATSHVATALPLAVRRWHPLPVSAWLAVVLVVQTTVLGESLHFGSFLRVPSSSSSARPATFPSAARRGPLP